MTQITVDYEGIPMWWRHSIVHNAHVLLDVVGRRFDSSVRPLMFTLKLA